jgi:hypothetical protein
MRANSLARLAAALRYVPARQGAMQQKFTLRADTTCHTGRTVHLTITPSTGTAFRRRGRSKQ